MDTIEAGIRVIQRMGFVLLKSTKPITQITICTTKVIRLKGHCRLNSTDLPNRICKTIPNKSNVIPTIIDSLYPHEPSFFVLFSIFTFSFLCLSIPSWQHFFFPFFFVGMHFFHIETYVFLRFSFSRNIRHGNRRFLT